MRVFLFSIVLLFTTSLYSNLIYYHDPLITQEGWGDHHGILDTQYGVDTEDGQSVIRTSDDGYLILANAENPFSQVYWQKGYILIKTTSLGLVEWVSQEYLFYPNNWYSVVEKHDGGYYFVGIRKIDTQNYRASLVEVNELGVMQGIHDFFSGTFTDIKTTSDGNYIITGCMGESPSSNKIALKINSDFDTLWLQSYYEYWGQIGHEIQETFDGGFILVSGQNGGSPPILNQALLKIDSEGYIEWSSQFGGGYTVFQTHDSGFISTGGPSSSLYITKHNKNGYYEWTKCYCEQIPDGYICYDIIQDSIDYSYVLVGSKKVSGNDQDIIVIKTNVYGDSIYSFI